MLKQSAFLNEVPFFTFSLVDVAERDQVVTHQLIWKLSLSFLYEQTLSINNFGRSSWKNYVLPTLKIEL